MLSLTMRGVAHGPGTPFPLLTRSNPWDAPELRTNDVTMPGSHGGLAGVDLLGMRRLTFVAQIAEPTQAQALDRMRELAAAWAPTDADVELSFTDDSGSYMLRGRPRQAKPFVENLGAGIVDVELRFAATDPFVYGPADKLTGTTAPTPSVGRVYPLVFPRAYGPAGSGGSMNVANDGTAPAPWRAIIVGPCSEPRLVGPGGQVVYGADLLVGETLTLDSRERTVLAQGTASRYALLTDFGWFTLPPGSSEVQFSTADGQGGVFFSWRDTWW